MSGRSGAIGRAFWDTYEAQFWPPNGVMDQRWKGPLHGTATSYNGVPAATYVYTSGGLNAPISQMGGPEKFASITDGTANTLLAGEYTPLDEKASTGDLASRRATFWAYTYASYNQSSITTESRIFGESYAKCVALQNTGQGGDNPCKRMFGSHHSNGANFVMCDASVRFVPYAVDINVLAAAATIAGGEAVPLP